MENSVSKANEKAEQFSGYLELKEYQRQTIEGLKPIYLAEMCSFRHRQDMGKA
jgi:hypothetical protein